MADTKALRAFAHLGMQVRVLLGVIMKIITTTANEYVAVSDEDYDYLVQFTWFLRYKKYATRWHLKDIPMHHEVADRMGLIYTNIDHKDRDPFNNQRTNLRIATLAQNSANQEVRLHANRTSKYKGVSWDNIHNKWKAQICAKRQKYHLGYFHDEIKAALAYNIGAIKHHKEFAVLNTIED